jgi:hypothetical protein
MRAAFFAALSCATVISGQMVMEPDKIGQAVAQMDATKDEKSLRCEVRPIRPALNFTFRFQAGYVVTVPMKQYIGTGNVWAILTRITPQNGSQGGAAKPVFLIDVIRLPPITEATKAEAESGGSYLLGEGRYNVSWMLMDSAGRTCRKSWQVEVALGRGDKGVKLGMPPGTVAGLSERGLPMRGSPVVDRDDAGPPVRLTVLVDSAPFTFRRTSRVGLSGYDRNLLLGMLAALLERLPSASVKLILFNLEQQRELLRHDGFQLRDLRRVSEALNRLNLGTIDASKLGNPGGHLGLLAGFINEELRAEHPADAVVFLGPRERYDEKMPPEMVDKPGEGAPHFFYLQHRPQRRPIIVPEGAPGSRPGGGATIVPFGAGDYPDSISRAIDRLKGDTIRVHTPAEFAKAIERLEKRTVKGRFSPADGPRRAN